MEPEKMKNLLERFYAGDTTLEEEALLREFFSQPEVPAEWSAEKAHFQMLAQWQSEEPLQDDFDLSVMEKISATHSAVHTSFGWYALAGIAASVLLVLALWIGNRQDEKNRIPGTTQNPALAYVQARSALQMVSGVLNEGMRPAEKATAEINMAMGKTAKLSALETVALPVQNLSKIAHAHALVQSFNRIYINFEPLKK
jgi:hypothetical protein